MSHEAYNRFRGAIFRGACSTTHEAIVQRRGVDPYGTGGTRPPNIWTGADMITNVPPIFLE